MPKLGLNALLNISEIDLTKDFRQILAEILTITGRAMDARAGSIILANEETGELEMVATFGLPDDYIELVHRRGVPISSSPSGVVLETGEYYLVPDIFGESGAEPWHELGRELNISAQIFMPIKRKGEVIGIMVIYLREPHEFTEDEIAFVSIAASQAAAVIENVRLYDKERQKSRELEREITERKQMEKALLESEGERQTILNSVPISIFHIDADSKFIHVNEVLAKRYGLKPMEFIGKTSRELFPEYAEEYIKSDEEVLECGEPQIGTIKKIKTPEGLRWVRLDKVPIKDADGNVTGIIGFELDITERKRAEEERRKSEERFRNTIENIFKFVPEGLLVLSDRLNVLKENKAFRDIVQKYSARLNYTEEELTEIIIEQVKNRITNDDNVEIRISKKGD